MCGFQWCSIPQNWHRIQKVSKFSEKCKMWSIIEAFWEGLGVSRTIHPSRVEDGFAWLVKSLESTKTYLNYQQIIHQLCLLTPPVCVCDCLLMFILFSSQRMVDWGCHRIAWREHLHETLQICRKNDVPNQWIKSDCLITYSHTIVGFLLLYPHSKTFWGIQHAQLIRHSGTGFWTSLVYFQFFVCSCLLPELFLVDE